MMRMALLEDRGVLAIRGADAASFLHRLVTNSVLDIVPDAARYAALLTPQGKLLADFFVVSTTIEGEPGFMIDCGRDQTPDLAKRLNLHKLRAAVTVADVSAIYGVAAAWGAAAPAVTDAIAYRDPRTPDMGLRIIASHAVLAGLPTVDKAEYEAHRIALGVPKGGLDFAYGDAFVHDAGLDMLNGVDFKKGCYVGQEVVARVHFRKSARKRIVKVRFEGPGPTPGTDVVAGDLTLGRLGSMAGADGLALLRLDRLEDARTAGLEVTADGQPLQIDVPAAFIERAGLEKAAI